MPRSIRPASGSPSRMTKPSRSFTPHVLALWRRAGAEIVPFSPLADAPPPRDCDACWLPGGYPELHAGRIAGARHFIAGMREFAAAKPVHGECGGYMTLGTMLEDAGGERHAMCGLLPVETSFARRKLHLGYRLATLRESSALGPRGTRLVGHEYHYASVCEGPHPAPALADVTDAAGALLGPAGHRMGHVSGTFFHVVARR